MRPKLVALIAASSLTTGWLLASIVSPPVAELQTLPERAPRRAEPREVPTVAPYTEQLHLKLQAAPMRPVPRRNPFVFGGVIRPAGRASAVTLPAPAMPIPEAPPAPAGPMLRLAGIASSNSDAGPVWTAIISDGGGIHLLKVGEKIAGFTIVEISGDAVVLTDAADQRRTLRLP